MALFNMFNKKKARKKPEHIKHAKKVKAKHVKPKAVKKVVKAIKAKAVQIKPLINKMDDEKACELLKRYKIKVADYAFCKNEKELATAIKKIGFPLAMKVSGKSIIHKTDVNGIRLNIKTDFNAVNSFKDLMKIRGFEKVIVQKMLTEGYEVIIGGRKDPQFNKVIALGAGGIFTEFLRDVSFRVSPITKEDAESMLMEVRFSDLLLKGFRGQKPANKESIVNTILSLSRLMEANPKIKEIDLNPVFATSTDAVVADVRIIIE